MRCTLIFSLTLLLFFSAWGSSSAVFATDDPEQVSSPRSERASVSVNRLPPLPFTKATMDLPRIRREQDVAIDSVREQSNTVVPPIVVARNGQTELDLSVDLARANGEKWIEVDLSEQKTYAWLGDELQNEFIISSGVKWYPTVEGIFRMWIRVPEQTMSGGDRASGSYYSLPNVQWVQYFYRSYAFHGTYWHNNFGTPMSHGCVNMTVEDAEWLFNWAMPEWNGTRNWMRSTTENATLVWIHQ